MSRFLMSISHYQFHRFTQRGGAVNAKSGVLENRRQGASANGFEKGKYPYGHDGVQLLGITNLHEVLPAKILVLRCEDILLIVDQNSQVFLLINLVLTFVQLADEQQVGELLDHVHGVGNTS